jgi:hypothetical protein
MNNKTDPTDSSLSETMAARIESNELGDPTHQKKITDAIVALDGVIEAKIENDAARLLRSAGHKRKENRAGYSFCREPY